MVGAGAERRAIITTLQKRGSFATEDLKLAENGGRCDRYRWSRELDYLRLYCLSAYVTLAIDETYGGTPHL